ncbi:MAG: hypothetical protein MI923_18805 [Phycisphaerales bacterium]|nr:hypothetical protein [Phycisphaerales bacterium]
MNQAFFWCYPWDLADEGYERALTRLVGEIGVDAVSVAATTHRVRSFRPRLTEGPRTVSYDAAAHFQPSGRCYANTQLRPTAAAWMKTRNPLEKIARLAEQNAIKLRVWTVCCQHDTLSARHPMATRVDVFGDRFDGWLCPSNPDVREYVAALAEDLTTNYPVETIELEAMDFDMADRRVELGIDSHPIGRALMDWCFCSSCRQRAMDAGVDTASVKASALSHLDRAFRLEPPAFGSFELLLANDTHLAGYQKMRIDAVTSLVQMVRSRTSARLMVHRNGRSKHGGADPSALAAHCDGFLLPWAHGRVQSDDTEDDRSKVEVRINCCPPHMKDGPSLVTQVHQASQAGHPAIGFHHYGMTPEPCLDWIRQAIRYARREA